MASEEFCADAAEHAGEGIEGSAVAETWRWVALEMRESWRDKVYEKAESLSHSVRATLDAALALPGARFQAIRHVDRREGPLALLLGHGEPGATWLRRFTLQSIEALAELDLASMLSSPSAPSAGEPVDEPVVLVCTHGKRDRCCALHGLAFYRALQDAANGLEVWQCSHLGGHRFAATAVALPSGHCYGWLKAAQAESFAEAIRSGAVFDLDHHRGRCVYPSPIQAAESHTMRWGGAWSVEGWEADGASWAVRVSSEAGETRTLHVRAETLDAQRPKSCGAAPSAATRWVVL